jgi:transketolase C-terminal domain/subunit
MILSSGFGSQWIADIVNALEMKGIPTSWTHISCIKEDLLDACLAANPKTKIAVVVEDHSERGGLADAFRRRAPRRIQIESIAWPWGWQSESGTIADLRLAYSLDTLSIVRKIERILALSYGG